MTKKKGRRSTNVARKREKRNRDRKFRQKQLALEKQRRLPHEKTEEEHLHACISESRKLLDEPEFNGLLFNSQLMHKMVMEVLDHHEAELADIFTDRSEAPLASEEDSIYLSDVNVDEIVASEEQPPATSDAEQACDHFRIEVLPHLVTPDFMEQLIQSLTACETRLNLTGNRELAEVAFVTRSLFEAAPPEILAFHPMIQAIGIETLRVLVGELDVIIDGREEVKEILSDVLAHEDSETYQPQPISVFSNTGLDEKTEFDPIESVSHYPEPADAEETDIKVTLSTSIETASDLSTEPLQPLEPEPVALEETLPPPPTLSPEALPARALYKNFNGLAIKENFEKPTDDVSLQECLPNYALANENEKQIEFADVENERYITITEDRLQLHARSETELTIAMAELEARCTSAVMYLAKTVKERG